MKYYFSCLFLLTCRVLLPCSGSTLSFCATHNERPSNPVIKGYIIASGSQSLQIRVQEVLHGNETRSVITVWDGKDFDCNGNVSMKVSTLGTLGDTILAILPPITSIQNAWDVVGDYSTPPYLFRTPVIPLKNNVLTGFVSGNYVMSQGWFLNKVSYTDFKSYWTNNNGDCTQLTALLENAKNSAPRLLHSENALRINCPGNTTNLVSLLSMEGKVIENRQFTGSLTISTEDLEPGIYFICIQNEKGELYKHKLIR